LSTAWNDRVPPHNIEAEQSVIRAIFLEPEAFSAASEILMPEDFYRASHQRVFAAMLKLSDRGEPIDIVTVTTYLNNVKQLEEVGGVAYLTQVAESVPTAANIEYYCRIVEEKGLLRRLIRAATDIVTSGFENEDDVEDVLNEAEKQILEVSSKNNSG